MTVSGLNDALLKLEELIQKLPGPVQKAMLNEVRPLRELFLEQRPPRILLMGDPGTPESMLIRSLFGRVVCGDGETVSIKPSGPSWFEFRREGRGAIRVMDLRAASESDMGKAAKALADSPPDAILYLQEESAIRDAASLDLLEAVISQTERRAPGRRVSVLGIAVADRVPVEETKWNLQSALFGRLSVADRTTVVESFPRSLLIDSVGATASRPEFHAFLVALCDALPNPAKVEMARITNLKEVQVAMAQILIRSATAVCGAVGTQPIPLADLPVLTSVQVAMLAGIVHLSGREFSARTIVEFLGAMGLNVGLGIAFREGARAVVKLLPGWGNAISGMVAAGGTFAVGKAASAYFIEGISVEGARKIFRAGKKRKQPKIPELPGRQD